MTKSIANNSSNVVKTKTRPKKYTTHSFIQKLIEKHGDKYDYTKTEYESMTTKIQVICKNHNHPFWIKAQNHLLGQGCCLCGLEKVRLATCRRSTTKSFVEKANKNWNNLYDYSEVTYWNCHTKVAIRCIHHGIFHQIPLSHLRGHGCPTCSRELQTIKQTKPQEEFISEANKIHNNVYNYDEVVYKNAHEKVAIRCKDHGLFYQIANGHLRGEGCIQCGKIRKSHKCTKTTEEFIKEANEVHQGMYTYPDTIYIKGNKKVQIECKHHGSFFQAPTIHLRGHGCAICSGNIKYTFETWKEACLKYHGNKYNYDKVIFIDMKQEVDIVCPVHDVFQQKPINHLNRGCNQCGIVSRTEMKRKPFDQFLMEAIKKHHYKYNYSKVKYVNISTKVEIICPLHGSFMQTPGHHLQRGQGCVKCSNRGGFSRKAIEWNRFTEEKENITIRDATNGGEFCIPGTRWKADGYCEETNTIYEFHGTIFHGDPRKCDPEKKNICGKVYGELYKKTLERENIIRSLGFNLVVMWEIDWDEQQKKKK